MALPTGGPRYVWPPESARPSLQAMAEHDAWYSGDADRLSKFYSEIAGGMSDSDGGAAWWRFHRRNSGLRGVRSRATLHVPLPGDIAAISAAMLFGEEPGITYPEAHEEKITAPGDEGEAGDSGPTVVKTSAMKSEERLLELLDLGGFYHRMSEAAEQCAAIGGVYLKIAWDETIAPYPFIVPHQADGALPEFKWGILQAVTFWAVVAVEGEKVWRHLERYEKGAILHGLYRGTKTALGEPVDLTDHASTADLLPLITLPAADMLAVRYVPNMRPNRRDRGSQLGQSDYAGQEGLFDALDEVYTSLMRDVRLAKARLVVPQDYLQVTATTAGGTSVRFDADQEVYAPINVEPGDEGGGSITMVQFAIRAAEHEQTAMNLIERIVTAAGYSPQTFGLHIEGRAESGTALRMREKRTLITHNRKKMLWQSPLADMLQMLAVIARENFGDNDLDPNLRPRVEIHDGLPDDPSEVITSVELLSRAGAASLETLVKMQHPEWDMPDVDAEVKRIRDQQGMNVPDPTALGIPAADDPNAPPA